MARANRHFLSGIPYGRDFTPEKGALRQENEYIWDKDAMVARG